MIAPMSAHIENTATARAAPATGRVAHRRRRRGAEKRRGHPVRAEHDDQQPDVRGERHQQDRDARPTSPPPIMAGRRPTVSTNLPAGPTAMVWATAAQAKAIPVQDGGRCEHLDHQHRNQRRAHPERRPALGQVREARRLIARDHGAPSRNGSDRLGGRSVRPLPPGVQHAPGRWCRPRPGCRRRRRTVRSSEIVASSPPTAGPVIPPIRNPPWKKPGGPPAQARVDRGEQQGEGRDGEHRRSDAAEPAEHEQLDVATARCRRARWRPRR